MIATYRLQLRNGVSFADASAALPHIASLGVSHLYLSPVFTADPGSTHGYDVTNPAEIDRTLGGMDGFRALSAQAKSLGLGIILDIVPNHTAFSLDNPWLFDVLQHGSVSRWGRHFDIDWSQRLVLPFLPRPFDDMLDAGEVELDARGLGFDDLRVPLAPESLPDGEDLTDPYVIRRVHDDQIWQLRHWERERDSINHRRFFNVTGLIGMRVEVPEVFDDMHALPLSLLREGLIDGLRLDHIDGLADPTAYLQRLRAEVGDAPIWVEKILVGDEPLPSVWPVQGTTGYEAARQMARVLTDRAGLETIDHHWRTVTGYDKDFHHTLMDAKHEVVQQDLAAELHQLIALAHAACVAAPGARPGQEALREAIIALLVEFPRYRTYLSGKTPVEGDLLVLEAAADRAAAHLRSDSTLRKLETFLRDGPTAKARAFRTRFEQITGALLAKSHEDTAGFRYTRYLAACEVGAEPDEATIAPQEFSGWLAQRAAHHPMALTLTSTHDTKRSEDARMRLVAISHLPDQFHRLWLHHADHLDGIAPRTGWYMLQSLLAIWEDRDDIAERFREHMVKALREAKEITNWPYPKPEAEEPVLQTSALLVSYWKQNLPVEARQLIARGQALSLIQLAMKMLMPGVPDVYQGTEVGAFTLTDPDNRLPVDFAAMDAATARDDWAGIKARATKSLLALRRDHADFMAAADARFDMSGNKGRLMRMDGSKSLALTFNMDGSAMPCKGQEDPLPFAVVWTG